jgi:hypothetical protein
LFGEPVHLVKGGPRGLAPYEERFTIREKRKRDTLGARGAEKVATNTGLEALASLWPGVTPPAFYSRV